MEMTWTDPPERQTGTRPGAYIRRFIAELEKNPGRWAMYRNNYTTRYPASLLRSRYKELAHIEWRDAKNDNGMFTVWARATGGSDV